MGSDPKEEEDLVAFWKVVRPSVPEGPLPDPSPTQGELILQVQGQVLVRIRPDGTHEFGAGYTPELGAKVFWEAIARAHPNAVHHEGEIESLTQQTMEMLMLRLGRADIHCEACRRAASEETATDHDKFLADLALRNLEVEAHRVIEFARELVERTRVPSSDES